MKILFKIMLIIMGLQTIQAQDHPPVVIKGSFSNISFEEFAQELKDESGIFIYYKPQWVEGLRITASGDSINLNDLLDEILLPGNINFTYKGSGQFFLTGEIKIDDSALTTLIEPLVSPDTIIRAKENHGFGVFSYERQVSRIVIGDVNDRNFARSSLLTGRITSAYSGEPVIGATLVVSGTNNAVITDGNGNYALHIESGNTVTLDLSCLGMQKESYIVEMNSSGVLNIEMEEQLIDIQEVVVKSGLHDNVRGMQMGFQRINVKEMKTIPAVMGERDILKVATMMPGVQTVGEGSTGFNVRGSSSDQNLFLLNDIPVLNTGHLFGFFSAFNPDMVSDFNLYKSNFPSEYGGRLASVFEISTRKGNKKQFGARGALSPVTSSLLIETPVVKDKASFILGGRSTYSDWILKKLDDQDIKNSKASFYDLMAGFHITPNDKTSWQVFTYYSKDKFRLASINDYMYENIGASVSWDTKLNEKLTINVTGVYSGYNNYQANQELPYKAFDHMFRVQSQELKTKFTAYSFLKHKLGFGGNIIFHFLDQGILKPLGSESLMMSNDFGKEYALEYALFVSDEFLVTDKLSLYAGLRYSFFNYLGPNDILRYTEGLPYEDDNITDTTYYAAGKSIQHYSGPEYRVSLNYEFRPDMSMKVSYNRMRQYLFMLSNTAAISPTDRWKLSDPYIKPPFSDQISIGLYKNFNLAALETSAEMYLKKTQNVVEYKDGADLSNNPNFENSILQGYQNSWGAEFLVKRNAGRFTGWMSYTYSRSMVTVDGEEAWQRINKGISYPANYDKPHAFNFVTNLRYSRRFSLGASMVYSTGRPITFPTGIIYVDGIEIVNYSLRNEYRIPDYFRVDISLNIEGNLKKRKLAHGSWMFAVYNVTGRKNAYSVYFKNEEGKIQGYKQSIYGVPIFTVSFNFKLGNYAVE